MKQVSVGIIASKVKALKELAKKNNISFSNLLDQMINMAYDKSKYEIIKEIKSFIQHNNWCCCTNSTSNFV